MKKVININFQGRVVSIEEVAYENLQQYVDSLRKYFAGEEGSDEIVNDIEWRISELFDEIIKKGNPCVTEEHLESIIKSIGRPQDLQQEDEKFHTQTNVEQNQSQSQSQTRKDDAPTAIPTNFFNGKKRLMRDETNKKLGGVCAGIANYFGIDHTLVRVVTVLLTLAYGVGIIIYIILWAALPGTTTTSIGSPNKKLFRNPTNKKIAGVCSGLAQYFDVDIWIVRLIFLLCLLSPAIFGILRFGFIPGSLSALTFLLYIILWIVMPKAVRPTDFLAMRGENIDINSIRSTRNSTVQEDNNDDKKKISTDMNNNQDASTQNFAVSNEPYYYQNNSTSFGNVLVTIVKIFAYIVLGIIIIVLISTLAGLGIAATFGLPYLNLYLEKDWQSTAAIIALVCFVWVPLIALVVWMVRKLVGYKHKNPRLRYAVILLWSVGLIAFITVIISSYNSIKYESEMPKQTISLANPSIDKLIIDFEGNDNKTYFRKNFRAFPFKVNNKFYIGNMNLDIEKSTDSNFHVYLQKYANGNSVNNANTWAKKIDIPIHQYDSVLTIEKGILINNSNKFRNQRVYITVEVPIGKKIYIKDNFFEMPNVQIGDFQWRKNRQWSSNIEYLMTTEGIIPTHVNTETSVSVTDDEPTIKKEIINGKTTYYIDDEEVDSLRYEQELQNIQNKKDSINPKN